MRSILQLLRRSMGVDFSHYKINTIRRRIIRRTLLFKFDALRGYVSYLRQHPEELVQLYDDLLINVTSFFRDTDTMDYVQKVLLPQIVREKPGAEPIRIWVPPRTGFVLDKARTVLGYDPHSFEEGIAVLAGQLQQPA